MDQFSTQMSSGRKIEDVIADRIYETQERLLQYSVGSPMYNKYWDDLQILRQADDGYDEGYEEGYRKGCDNTFM